LVSKFNMKNNIKAVVLGFLFKHVGK
jgi:hypothetical protein